MNFSHSWRSHGLSVSWIIALALLFVLILWLFWPIPLG